ncbi:hypothetical protein CK203_091541 [Vitis vinifera]|uniref:Integrase catalytic domain-containing protein n=1 Tax=Vitis vinifera TaxID=29760 RepID=A0A438ED42_VITVI|nr:hypothetical protein CK203_091541 [Vitis vinifera]
MFYPNFMKAFAAITQGAEPWRTRAHSQGYYWPTMRQDVEIYVRKCRQMPKTRAPHMPAETLNSVTSPWPFAQWGMDIVGPLPHCSHSEEVSARCYASIKDKDVKRFVWKNIVCRFGIPQAIITDNDPQFDISAFKAKGKWVEKLSGVLWAYRTTPGRPTGNTPFALTYGTDVVIPTEVGMPTARTVVQGQRNEDDKLARHLDWADEAREAASIRMAAYQQNVAAYYNRKVRPWIFKEGSLVLRKIFENMAEKGAEKFQAN